MTTLTVQTIPTPDINIAVLNIDFSDFEDTYNSKNTTAQSLRFVIISLAKNVKRKYEE